MIDFRYHLVSIVAVFLALAIGVAIGTTALNGPVLDDLQGRVDSLLSDNRDLEQRIRTLDVDRTADDQFAEAVAPVVVADRLTARNVVLVATDGALDEDVELVRTAVAAAGGEVTGSVRLAATWGSDEGAAAVDDLVVQALPAGVSLPDGDPWARAASLLAAALVDPQDGVGAVTAGDVTEVVDAFREADLLTVVDDEVRPGTLAVLVGPPADEQDEQEAASSASPGPEAVAAPRLADLALALDRRGEGAVVTGGTAGVVPVVRQDEAVRQVVSTVAPLSGAQGAVGVVLALEEQAAGGSGQYGRGDGVDAVAPDVTPFGGLPELRGTEPDGDTGSDADAQ